MTDHQSGGSDSAFIVHLLGGFRLSDPNHLRVRIRSRKARALLAYLAMPVGRSHQRDELAALLWPHAPRAHARASVRRALSDLRRALGPSLRSSAGAVSLRPGAIDTDVARFVRATAGTRVEALGDAAAHYGGDFLARLHVQSEPFTRWQLLQRQHLRSRMLVCEACRQAAQQSAIDGAQRIPEHAHAC